MSNSGFEKTQIPRGNQGNDQMLEGPAVEADVNILLEIGKSIQEIDPDKVTPDERQKLEEYLSEILNLREIYERFIPPEELNDYYRKLKESYQSLTSPFCQKEVILETIFLILSNLPRAKFQRDLKRAQKESFVPPPLFRSLRKYLELIFPPEKHSGTDTGTNKILPFSFPLSSPDRSEGENLS